MDTIECSICLFTKLNDNNVIILPCNHCLCKKCYYQIINLKNNYNHINLKCPFCRTPFNKNDIINPITQKLLIEKHNKNIIELSDNYDHKYYTRSKNIKHYDKKYFYSKNDIINIDYINNKKNKKINSNKIKNDKKNHIKNNININDDFE